MRFRAIVSGQAGGWREKGDEFDWNGPVGSWMLPLDDAARQKFAKEPPKNAANIKKLLARKKGDSVPRDAQGNATLGTSTPPAKGTREKNTSKDEDKTE